MGFFGALTRRKRARDRFEVLLDFQKPYVGRNSRSTDRKSFDEIVRAAGFGTYELDSTAKKVLYSNVKDIQAKISRGGILRVYHRYAGAVADAVFWIELAGHKPNEYPDEFDLYDKPYLRGLKWWDLADEDLITEDGEGKYQQIGRIKKSF